MRWDLHPSNVNTGLPLEGVRVLDLSRVLAGPLAAMIAGDLGADVIKVEGPGGDPVRSLAPPSLGELATYYLAVNRHRRNIVADLGAPEGYALVSELIAVADAVIENFLPSQARALGVDELRRAHPSCVWISVTPASSGGPLADEPSFDLLAQARSGLMGVTGDASGPPTKVGAPLADVVAGLYGAVALVSGLYARGAGRGGSHVEVPLLESTMSALVNQAQGYLSTGVAPGRLGNDHPSIAPYGVFATRDGFVMLAVGTDAQYARLLDVLDDEALRTRLEWARNAQRVEARADLAHALAGPLRAGVTEEWLERLGAAGVPAAPIHDVAGAFSQAQITGGDFVTTMDTPEGPTTTMTTPLVLNGRRPAIRRGPRALGEDTAEISAPSKGSSERG